MRLLALLFGLLLPAAAAAGDYADLAIVGFSPDGKYFAYIEHGVQDGSGFPYANAYVIDTATDSWVPGTPVRVLFNEEDSSDAKAYAKAAAGIAPLIKKLNITSPAAIVADNPITELGIDPHSMLFLPVMPVPMDQSRAYKLVLTERPLPAPGCPVMVEPNVGFRLVLADLNGMPRTFHNDSGQLPASRRCPTGYGISAIAFDPARKVMAVMIDVFSVGFEGPDRRFLAVTGRFE